MKKTKKITAFTLAEALLTITIIGVVSIMMVRSINRVSPDKEKILFVKTFHAIEHVIVNIMNDPTKYNQNYYSEEQLAGLTEAERNELSTNFSTPPLSTAQVNINGSTIYACTNANANQNECINKNNAKCYFIADAINTTDTVDCQSDNGINFKTSTGVCIRNLANVNANGDTEAIIDPTCGEKNSEDKYTTGYAINIFADGKVTVPEISDSVDSQATAYNWILDQTQVK